MSYLIFRDVSTKAFPGVQVSKMPSHKRAAMRYTEYYVKGRDGALHIDDGYSNMDLEVTLVLIDAKPETRQQINAWATGTGKLVMSDDLTKAYRASVKKEVRWTRVRGNNGFYDTAKITFDCQPFMYEVNETEIALTSSANISNPGTAEAIPLIKVEGSGTASFTIGGETVQLEGMSGAVYLDCENGYAWTDGGNLIMRGDFPIIPTGVSAVTIGGGVSRLTITPHWRWI